MIHFPHKPGFLGHAFVLFDRFVSQTKNTKKKNLF